MLGFSVPPLASIPSTTSNSPSFESFAGEPRLSFANYDSNLLPMNDHTSSNPVLNGINVPVDDIVYSVPSTFPPLLDSGSREHQTLNSGSLSMSSFVSQEVGNSLVFPVSQFPGSPCISLSSQSASQGDEALSCLESSRVTQRRLNTVAARRYRQRRIDRMKNLEDELACTRRERDELRLKVSKLEGETEALKELLL